jgi:hypothetical protein
MEYDDRDAEVLKREIYDIRLAVGWCGLRRQSGDQPLLAASAKRPIEILITGPQPIS